MIPRTPVFLNTAQAKSRTHISLSSSSAVNLGLPCTRALPDSSFGGPLLPPPPLPSPRRPSPRLDPPPLLRGGDRDRDRDIESPPPGTYRSTPSGGGLRVFVLRPGLRLLSLLPRSLSRLLSSPLLSMRSNRLRPGFTAVSNGFRATPPPPPPPPLAAGPREAAGPEGMSVSRMGCPLAFAPSNSRIASRAGPADR